ncbi:MAG: DUF3842 family protein [Erysipelotrichaceae bacterium]|nr:DUF3842 family protein [Erysipelotrichaceae bacterium]
MKIVVIDGQGGKIGKAVCEQLVKSGFGEEVIAIGTNAIATAAMLKTGVQAATGENPVVVNSRNADYIVGPMGIIAANSLLGEITPNMAMAVSESGARKILIPMNKCNIAIVGVEERTVTEYIKEACDLILAERKQ